MPVIPIKDAFISSNLCFLGKGHPLSQKSLRLAVGGRFLTWASLPRCLNANYTVIPVNRTNLRQWLWLVSVVMYMLKRISSCLNMWCTCESIFQFIFTSQEEEETPLLFGRPKARSLSPLYIMLKVTMYMETCVFHTCRVCGLQERSWNSRRVSTVALYIN